MELNKFVFPSPPSSYTHLSINRGHISSEESKVGSQLKLAPGKMLYIPKFEMFTTSNSS